MANSLAKIVAKAAPLLGLALGGIGAPIGMIVAGIASLFGGADTDEDLIEKIKADPDAYLKLKEFEMQHQKDLLKITADDRNSARNKHIQHVKTLGKRDWVMDFLSITPFLALTAISFIAIFKNPTGSERDFFYSIFDMFSSFLAFVMGYHFGGVSPQQERARRTILTDEDKD